MNKIELLAPAGDLQRLKTAVRYGADAVYIGGRQFSLRSRASNFTLEDIREGAAFAREHGAAVHVTVNMLPHEDDFDGLKEYVEQPVRPACMRSSSLRRPSPALSCSISRS
ncbi:MAG: peptidase U32 family protein [Merdibacter sp.]